MHHQAQAIGSAALGHRTYLLADEPGLGKTAQALLAAEAAGAFPLLAVVPNVVKTNWAREVEIWTPHRKATVLHGDGDDADGFADVFIVNYEILDRHVGWLGNHGFRGMIVDEAHYIKNKSSQRSQNVLEISSRIRARIARPLLMALTGTPLINDIEDFRAIWQFLGWIDDVVPQGDLMEALEETGLTPADPAFYPAARRAVIDEGIVRRRKIDVAADIPARRVADMPVELEGEAGRSIRKAEQELARRMVERYDAALSTRRAGAVVEGIDHHLVRQVAGWEREDNSAKTGENVFTMMRRIGRAKAGLAADYTAQAGPQRRQGGLLRQAHRRHGHRREDLRRAGDQVQARSAATSPRRPGRSRSTPSSTTPRCRSRSARSPPRASASTCRSPPTWCWPRLSWTDAEQTQAIDRVHRIGQAEPVTAWRVIATQTLDTRIAEPDRQEGRARGPRPRRRRRGGRGRLDRPADRGAGRAADRGTGGPGGLMSPMSQSGPLPRPPAMSTLIAVAGGTGLVGRLVVDEVRRAGATPVVVARSAGVDLTTGAGLDAALAGVDAVIDASNVETMSGPTSVAFFEAATGHLLAAGERAGVRHHVALSIVGCDRVDLPYYLGKRRQEEPGRGRPGAVDGAAGHPVPRVRRAG
ncbi:SNF2-related protein [Nocardioides convexus]|uniref:SNF2-related protein n=1 Tax=Nocardioides convexus TaxID=2712224 RepID=UPI0024181B95|nr:SNF2-related protein [Nocardioides convexus]